jgi:hypothetical protein
MDQKVGGIASLISCLFAEVLFRIGFRRRVAPTDFFTAPLAYVEEPPLLHISSLRLPIRKLLVLAGDKCFTGARF